MGTRAVMRARHDEDDDDKKDDTGGDGARSILNTSHVLYPSYWEQQQQQQQQQGRSSSASSSFLEGTRSLFPATMTTNPVPTRPLPQSTTTITTAVPTARGDPQQDPPLFVEHVLRV